MHHLNYNEQGGFRICQLTDLHLSSKPEREENNKKTLELIKSVIQSQKPDLLALTGDISHGENNGKLLEDIATVCQHYKIPWAATLGNHDGNEEGDALNREELADLLETLPMSLFKKGPQDIMGYGNYFISVGDENSPDWALVFIDSNNRRDVPSKDGGMESAYDYIHRNQIDWYLKESEALEKRFGKKLSELAFFHIPLWEYLEAWGYNRCVGQRNEYICCPKTNTGMFAAMVDRGGMKGTFVGHDHINDFDGKLFGIRLCYGRGSGHNAYGMYGYPLGARIIDIDSDSSDFSSYIYLEDGSCHKQTVVHKPEHHF